MDIETLSGEIYADKDEIKGWAISQSTPDEDCQSLILASLMRLKANKPQDRSDKARHYAIVITELEKAYAYFKTFVIDAE